MHCCPWVNEVMMRDIYKIVWFQTTVINVVSSPCNVRFAWKRVETLGKKEPSKGQRFIGAWENKIMSWESRNKCTNQDWGQYDVQYTKTCAPTAWKNKASNWWQLSGSWPNTSHVMPAESHINCFHKSYEWFVKILTLWPIHRCHGVARM